MLLRVVVSLASLLFFAGFAAAGIYAPDCSSAWKWSFNSLGQNACTVAAFLLSTCNGGSFTINALPSGDQYAGPTSAQSGDLCACNTVTYNLVSACDACQGATWLTYSDFTSNCTTVLTAGSFPNPVPTGTYVPKWALSGVTDTWDPIGAALVGDSPESGPGTKIG